MYVEIVKRFEIGMDSGVGCEESTTKPELVR